MKQAELTSGESQSLPAAPARRGPKPIPYDPEIVAKVCEQVASGSRSLVTILSETPGAPSYSTWLKWLNSNDEMAMLYARAKEHQADFLAEQVIDIVDDAKLAPHDKRVRFEGRKWVASKLNPRRYGDSIDVTSGGAPLPAAQLNQVTIDQRVQTIMLLAQARKEADSLLE
jgi:hypothetical protein